jgi:predicted phosphodiesterase
MKIGIISDIHGNLEALKCVISDMYEYRIQIILCLGDIIGYGSSPRECVRMIRYLAGDNIVMGNHEDLVADLEEAKMEMSAMAFEGVRFCRSNLPMHDLDFLMGLPLVKVLPEFDITLAHASFRAPHDWGYYLEMDTEADWELGVLSTRYLALGHTHIPILHEQYHESSIELAGDIELDPESKYLFNPGSVGQPRDFDPRASYAILDVNGNKTTFILRRVEYDIKKTEDSFRAAGLSSSLWERLYDGR